MQSMIAEQTAFGGNVSKVLTIISKYSAMNASQSSRTDFGM
jgi:hypothetical protein